MDQAWNKRPPTSVVNGDARNLDKALMLGATFARMAVSLITFIVLARYLGPEPFGVMATAVAYSTFLALISDYGLGLSALRDAAASPERTGAILREALILKVLIATVATLAATIAAVLVLPASRLPVYALALAGALAYSFADLILVAARASRRFDIEAKVVIAGSAMMLAVVGSVTALTGDIMYAAVAFAGSRLLYAVMTAVALISLLGGMTDSTPLRAGIIERAKRSTSYAIDAILTNASSQIDILLFGALLGAHEMGIYQAGARLVQVIMPLAVVLSSVYLPALAAAASRSDGVQFSRNADRLNYEFLVLSVVAGLGFAYIGPLLTPLIFGKVYASLTPLWPGFAVFAALRMLAAAYGIQLAAVGQIRPRIASQLAAVITLSLVTAACLPIYGVRSTSWILAISSIPSLLILASALSKTTGLRKSLITTVIVIAVVAMLIILV